MASAPASDGRMQPGGGVEDGTATADVASLPVRNPLLVVFGIMTASLLQILDTTIANVAIPDMRAALGATPDQISWVLTSYIVASAIAIPATIATNWYLETLSVAGIALVFVLYLALFNGLAVVLRRGKGAAPGED